MDERLFLNSEVVSITGLTQRQIISWAEKGLIVPRKEAFGPGYKREYTYINLLELELIHLLLHVLGLRFWTVSRIMEQLRGKVFVLDDEKMEVAMVKEFCVVAFLGRIRKKIDNALKFY